MAILLLSLSILLFFAGTGRLQETQACMRGFLDEAVLRSKAAQIGRTVTRQREQVIIPSIGFTCAGSISTWRFVAERNTGSRRSRYPQLQIWRPQQNSQQMFDLVQSVTVTPHSTAQSNIYTHTMTTSIQYQAGDVLGLHHPSSDDSVYEIYSVQHGGPDNYHFSTRESSSVQFDIQSSGVRVRRDYPLVGVETDNPQCLSGFLTASILDSRAQALSGDDRYQALPHQQRLIPSLGYGCSGKIGRVLVAAQNRGIGGGRDRYPEIHVMRLFHPTYYLLDENLQLNELSTVNSPNVLEFTPTRSISIQPGDVIRIYQPPPSDSVYEVYHEPGVGPQNHYIDGFPSTTRTVFPLDRLSSEDVSQPLFRVELIARCPSVQSLVNGNVERSSDSVAVYECDSGYRLDGMEQRLCNNETAEWNGRDPQCILVDCGAPPEIDHGLSSLSGGTVLGSLVTYSCERQYVLDGISTRQCQENSQWSGQSPICKRQCRQLSNPQNGFVSAPSQPVEGDTATFDCSSNYELIGGSTSTCLVTGQWAPEPPTCELIQCPELHSPGNGVVVAITPLDRRVGSTATFQCEEGYQLSGQATVRCLQNGQWSSESPTCQQIECQSLRNPLNGRVQVTDREAVYICNVGYYLLGAERRHCQLNGSWSDRPPHCELILCPVLSSPGNGTVDFSVRYVGSAARYTCNTGYVLVGVANVTCEMSTRQWSSPAPSCERIDCGPPKEPRNGFVTLSGRGQTHVNNTANYSCSRGYRVQGDKQRVCQLNGLWSGNVPGCLAVDCGQPPGVPHAWVSTNGTRLHDVATYHCTTGYRPTGGGQLVCQHQGQWAGTPPSCRVVTCGRLPQPNNGEVSWNTTNFNSIASYTCSEGYVLVGVSERVCQASGYWSNRPPLCLLLPISVLPISTTTTFTLTSVEHRFPSLNTNTATQSSLYRPPSTTPTDHHPSSTTPTDRPSSTRLTDHPLSTTLTSHASSTIGGPIVPTISNTPTTESPGTATINVFIICGIIVLMIAVIILLLILISMVYARRRKTNALAAATANSVENPVYSGRGGTPLATLNCLQLTNSHKPHTHSGLELQVFGFQSVSDSETRDSENHFGMTSGVHLYDFPSLSSSHQNYTLQEDGGGMVHGHSYEFPDHYHLATQYEIPVAPYEKPRPLARVHIYKNTLPADIYVPTLEEREKSATAERQRQVSCKRTLGASKTDETMFFSETTTYWRPASDSAGLYEQLAKNKYREINRKHIQVTELLGSGQFGQVNKGLWQRAGGTVEVAIKTLKEGSVEGDKVRFLQEAAISGQFQHPNVVRLQGVVTVGEPIMIILELLPNGDLRRYLHKQRPVVGEKLKDTWPKQLLQFCQDIVSGMVYLSSKAFIHRDLAARNILVAEDHTCKIGDFGMSRDLDDENYYISNGGKIPVKWTAPEALHYKKYSTASDVWSFGCLMYEIWSLGHKPFQKNSNTEAIKMTDQGLRLPPPPGCPRAIYQLMIHCWHPRTAYRPTFQALLNALSRDSVRLLSWGEGDTGAHSQAPMLGAPLEAGLDLYVDLQRTYIISTVSSS